MFTPVVGTTCRQLLPHHAWLADEAEQLWNFRTASPSGPHRQKRFQLRLDRRRTSQASPTADSSPLAKFCKRAWMAARAQLDNQA
jgi:hypothetical protein